MLIVVAKLVTNHVDHGLHLFVVPLRDTKGTITPGITVVDCGQKMGTISSSLLPLPSTNRLC